MAFHLKKLMVTYRIFYAAASKTRIHKLLKDAGGKSSPRSAMTSPVTQIRCQVFRLFRLRWRNGERWDHSRDPDSNNTAACRKKFTLAHKANGRWQPCWTRDSHPKQIRLSRTIRGRSALAIRHALRMLVENLVTLGGRRREHHPCPRRLTTRGGVTC